MPLKSLSQRGLIRIPRNALQRQFLEGGTKPSRKTLESFNEHQEDRQLHPTKGFRGLSVRRGRAQYLMAHIFDGGTADTATMRRFLQHGY
ncbi:hypothetical protein JP75_07655 [Devosia riboflavina]|uniref:Uncharacterized protein n=1 Tax=Devosia riboflavina TaxID=46914 RepID=A0A087M3H2_9HYPH|nr:hypothetical protein [Devosia riboflavina]KFL31425.1 hypothetical protein JP75_07655 [Devosia riboflavina]